MPLFSYESFYSSWLQTSHQPYLKLKLSSCTNYWILQKSSNKVTGKSHSIGAINFTTQDFNGLMQLRPFYFDIQINVSPWFAAQKTLASHVLNFSRLFLSTILYDLSAILQAERLAFRLYDALKIRSTGSFSFLAVFTIFKILQICDCILSMNSGV